VLLLCFPCCISELLLLHTAQFAQPFCSLLMPSPVLLLHPASICFILCSILLDSTTLVCSIAQPFCLLLMPSLLLHPASICFILLVLCSILLVFSDLICSILLSHSFRFSVPHSCYSASIRFFLPSFCPALFFSVLLIGFCSKLYRALFGAHLIYIIQKQTHVDTLAGMFVAGCQDSAQPVAIAALQAVAQFITQLGNSIEIMKLQVL
jgi:hypothetical protein